MVKEIKFPIKIKVKAGSKKDGIEFKDGIYYVNVKAPAKDNKANLEVIKLFSKLSGRRVGIVKGIKSKEKIIDKI